VDSWMDTSPAVGGSLGRGELWRQSGTGILKRQKPPY
jgi:hypothetical protein